MNNSTYLSDQTKMCLLVRDSEIIQFSVNYVDFSYLPPLRTNYYSSSDDKFDTHIIKYLQVKAESELSKKT